MWWWKLGDPGDLFVKLLVKAFMFNLTLNRKGIWMVIPSFLLWYFFLHAWIHYSDCNAFDSWLLINTVKNLLWKLFSSFDIKLMVLFLYDILRQEFMWSWQIEDFILSFYYWFNPSMCLPFIHSMGYAMFWPWFSCYVINLSLFLPPYSKNQIIKTF